MASKSTSTGFSWLPYILAAWVLIDLAFIYVGGDGLWWGL